MGNDYTVYYGNMKMFVKSFNRNSFILRESKLYTNRIIPYTPILGRVICLLHVLL